MIRYLAAPLWLALRRIFPDAQPPGAFRILLLHDVMPQQEAAFDRLLAHIGRTAGFMVPGDVPGRLAMAVSDGACPVLVSFDDGFASNHTLAKSVLARHGVKALFFICPGLMDLPREKQPAAVAANVFRGKADTPPPLMAWEQAAELVEWGHTVGGHGMSHIRLSNVDSARLEDEIGGARRRLGECLGVTPEWFAFPFGDISSVNRSAFRVVARHFRYCRSGVRGSNSARTPPLGLLAEHIDLHAPFAYQRMALGGGLDRRYAEAREQLKLMSEIV